MDLKCTSTGKIFRRIDPTLACILCEALPSVFERVEYSPAGPRPDLQHSTVSPHQQIPNHAAPVFEVVGVTNAITKKTSYYIQLLTGRTEYKYVGPADDSPAFFARMGFTVPEDVVDRYRRLTPNHVPLVPPMRLDENEHQANKLAEKAHEQKEAAAAIAEVLSEGNL